jgi:hypothetical protein
MVDMMEDIFYFLSVELWPGRLLAGSGPDANDKKLRPHLIMVFLLFSRMWI